MKQWFDKLWHDILRRPYRLAVPVNEGKGPAVVLLHGLASNHRAWGYVLPHLSKDCRVVALDLLGFGDSPKPKDCEYTARDHARSVITTLHSLGIYRNAIIVGHSMGALVAVEVARREPWLVKQLILCSMPIYQFETETKGLLPRQEALFSRAYGRLVDSEILAWNAMQIGKRLKSDPKSFGVERSELYAAQRSLANTIMRQTTYNDIQNVRAPIHFIGGRLDVFVIRRHLNALGKLAHGSTLKFLNESHDITERYGKYIARAVNDALKVEKT